MSAVETNRSSVTEPLEILVIGAGQAGLAVSYWLTKQNVSHLVIEATERIGDLWRSRYQSLTLFTPRAYSSLPGLELTGNGRGYASATEFADYLVAYAEQHRLPVRTGSTVERLTYRDRRFVAHLASGTQLYANKVVVATGAFQQVAKPSLASLMSSDVVQLDAQTYRKPDDLPEGTVVVVGDGASGRDIAADLAATHNVALACGRRRRLLPERILGRTTWWWLDRLSILRARAGSIIGRWVRKSDPFPNRDRALTQMRAKGIEIKPRLVNGGGNLVRFADGSETGVNAIIWATGYVDDFAWIDIPQARDGIGDLNTWQGWSLVPGLHFIGRPWQQNRASALIAGVGRDAKALAARIGGTVDL